MNSSLNIPEKFTVEQAFSISTIFFYELWGLIESRVLEEERLTGTYSLFFITICTGEESSGEWNEAIYRFMKIAKAEQRNLTLTLQETFSCAVEFCKLHDEFFNERYKTNLSYAVGLLDSMKENPELYPDEWKCWNTAVNNKVQKYMDDEGWFDWDDEPSYVIK